MKAKTIWIIIIVIAIIMVVGYFTNWFGLGKMKTTTTTATTTTVIPTRGRLFCSQYDSEGNCVKFNI